MHQLKIIDNPATGRQEVWLNDQNISDVVVGYTITKGHGMLTDVALTLKGIGVEYQGEACVEASGSLKELIENRIGTRTLAEAARECGISRHAMGRIRSGKSQPSMATYRLLLKWLGIDEKS